MRDRTGLKSGCGWKKKEENHFDFFTELLLEDVTVNEKKNGKKIYKPFQIPRIYGINSNINW